MKTDSIIIAVLYGHFFKMKEKGRNVIPWFQTVAVMSFSIVLVLFLVGLIILELAYKGNYNFRTSEMTFLVTFMGLVILLFFIIKARYFNTNKYLKYYADFTSLSLVKQKRHKIVVLTIMSLLPFLCLFILYIFDKRN